MPTYQYACKDCGYGFEQVQKFSDDPLTECPNCGGSVHRVIQNVGVVFKGSGWYINDSRKPASDSNASSKPTDSKETAKPAAEKTSSETTKPAVVAAEKSV
jgi:putative FmdB family regulatory protein